MTLWALATILPLLTAAVLVGAGPAGEGAARLRDWPVRLAQLSLVPSLALTLLPPDETGLVAAAEIPGFLLGTTVALDPVGRPLLLVAVVLYAAALTAVSWRYTRRAAQLKAFLLVAFVGNMGVYAATDAVTFYLGFAVMSFSAAGLVFHDRTPAADRAGRVYLVLTVLSEAAVLGALLLISGAGGLMIVDAPAAVAESGRTSVIVALLIVGFGTKAGLVPLHVWLPLAHPAAPPSASAVLSGAMVKAGLVGWLRFLPLGEVGLESWGRLLVILALLGALGAALLGVGQSDPKVVLAYSTISQMGYLSAVVGVALAQPALAPAATASAAIYAVHHGLAKGALFLGVPVWKHHGRGPMRWIVSGGLVLAALAVAGAPFTSGALGKYATKSAVEGVSFGGVDLVHLLPFVATGSTLLLVRFIWLLVHTQVEPLPTGSDPELPAWCVIVLTSLVLPWWVAAAWLPVTAVPGLDPITLWGASWPVLLGAVASTAFLRRSGTRTRDQLRETAQRVPAGDLIVFEERVLVRLVHLARRAAARLAVPRRRMVEDVRSGRARMQERAVEVVRTVAGLFESYVGSGVLVLLLLLFMLVQGVGR